MTGRGRGYAPGPAPGGGNGVSLQGNTYVEVEMRRLLEYMNMIADRPAEEQLRMLRERIEETKKAAGTGWL